MEKGLLRRILLSGLFTAVLLLCGMPMGRNTGLCVVQAEDYRNLTPVDGGDCGETEQDSVKWAVYDTDGDGLEDTLVFSGKGVMKETSIDSTTEWKKYKDNQMVLVIEDGVTKIGKYALYSMSNLTGNLSLPDSVESIGDSAFGNCSGLDGTLTIPAEIKQIGEWAFYNCSNLKGQAVLPKDAVVIPKWVYARCSSLTGTLNIPDTVMEIGDSAFYDAGSLSGELKLPDHLQVIGESSFENCTGFTGDLCIPDGISVISEYAFFGCKGFNGTLCLPEQLDTIGGSAFSGCSGLTGDLELPASLTTIEARAFSGCNNMTGVVTIPAQVKEIGDSAFYNCSKLDGICLGNVESIEECAFYNCSSLSGTLVLPAQLKKIEEFAFSGCSNLSGELAIPEGIEEIGKYTFSKCGFTSLKLPQSLKTIGDFAFWSSSFQTDIVIPEGVTALGEKAFSQCGSMQDSVFIVPYSITSIGDSCFSHTKAKVYNLSLQTITGSAFTEGPINILSKSCDGDITARKMLPQGVHDEFTLYHQFPYEGYDDTENSIWYTDGNYTKRITAPITVTADTTVFGREKAEQTGFAITDVTGIVYGGEDFELSVTGGKTDGAVTFSAPENNGVITLDGNKVSVIGAGTVTVTAKKEGDGDYKPAIAVKEIIVSPKAVTEDMVSEIEPQRYTGEPIRPNVVIRDGDTILNRSKDYTVEYTNNTDICDITGENPPTAVIKGINNYTGEIVKAFTIVRPLAEVTIAEGKEQITKTYGDEKFLLEGITKTGDGALTYTVLEGADVITVSGTGEVAVQKAGKAVISVSTVETIGYSSAEEKLITITVNKALKAPYIPLSKMYVGNGCEKVGEVSLPAGWKWDSEDSGQLLVTDEAVKATAFYDGNDKGNYITESIEVQITRVECDHILGDVTVSADCECDEEPACEKAGYGHKECTLCHHIVEVYIEVAALGHTGGEAGCSKKAVCERCGKEYGELDSNKHGETVLNEVKATTCTEDGYSGNKYCKECGKKIESGVVTKSEGHKWDAGQVTKEATAAENGEITYTCSVCKEIRTEAIPMLSGNVPAVGTILTDPVTKAVYQITSVDTNGASVSGNVQYVKSSVKNVKKVTIAQTITVDGITYKVTAVASSAFKNQKKLTQITMGSNVTLIGANAFSGCKALKTVKLNKNMVSIGNKAFYKCTKLKKIEIPAKVEKIGKQAFYGCKRLKTITIKTKKLTAKKVGKQAFKGVSAKVKIKVPKNKQKAYRKLLKSRGAGSKAKIV